MIIAVMLNVFLASWTLLGGRKKSENSQTFGTIMLLFGDLITMLDLVGLV